MVGYSFSTLVLYFFLYSAIGWICETLYCSLPKREFVNRGFFHGPYCPIYGFGALLVLLALNPLLPYPVLVFLGGVVLTSVLEYVTSWLMENLFGIRWWDYSDRRFNIKGRICLRNSLLFGLMGIVMLYGIHPTLARLVQAIPRPYTRVLASVLIGILVIDLLLTLNILIGLEEKLWMLQSLLTELQQANREHGWYEEEKPPRTLRHLYELAGDKLPPAILSQIKAESSLRANMRRMLQSFPSMHHTKLDSTLQTLRTSLEAKHLELKSELKAKKEKYEESWGRRLWRFTKALPGKTGAAIKKQAASFASGLNFYKLVWVFAISCIIGFVLETLFCLVTKGYIESRQGMLYGPFNQVYGFGAVLMVLLLHRLTKYKDRWLFIGGALVGGAFEFVCSFLQEKAFGTVSWEYSEHPLNVAGRTSITYMFFWGILAVVLLKGIYPWMSRLIERIPNRQGVFFTWVLVIFLSANMLLSAVAVMRWSERGAGIPPQNSIQVFLDETYPDDVMKEVYPNMQQVH